MFTAYIVRNSAQTAMGSRRTDEKTIQSKWEHGSTRLLACGFLHATKMCKINICPAFILRLSFGYTCIWFAVGKPRGKYVWID